MFQIQKSRQDYYQLSVSSKQLAVNSHKFNKKYVYPENPVILSKIFIFMLFMSFMVNIYSAPAKLAIIGDTEKYQNQVDLLTVELSQDKNVHLLERSDWDYLLREHEISQSNIAQKSIQFGRLLGADGLIIVTEETIKDKKYLLSKLLAVKTGIILDSLVSPIDNKDKSFNWSESIKARFQSKFAKLRNSQENIVTVSMLNLRSSLSTPELLTFEREINTIFAHRLMQEENILVSERWNMAEATFEKYVAGEDESEFKTGTNIIEGTINLKDNDNIEIKLIVRSPDGKKQEITVIDKKENLAEFAEKLTTEFLKVAKVTHKTIRYDRAKEAEEYYKEAQWAFNAGLYKKAAQSAESAWALGLRTNEMIFMRIFFYTSMICPKYSKDASYNILDYKYGHLKYVNKNIDAIITALELYKHHILKKQLTTGRITHYKKIDNSRYNKSGYELGEDLIAIGSYLLYSYYKDKSSKLSMDKIEFLKMLILNQYTSMQHKHKRSMNNDLYLIAMIYIPFWHNNYEYVTKEYLRLFSLDSHLKTTQYRNSGGGCDDNWYNRGLVTAFLYHRDKYPAIIKSKDLTNFEYEEKFITQLINSEHKHLNTIAFLHKHKNNKKQLIKFYWDNFDLFYSQNLFIPHFISDKLYKDPDFIKNLYSILLDKFQSQSNINWDNFATAFLIINNKYIDFNDIKKMYIKVKKIDSNKYLDRFIRQLKLRYPQLEVEDKPLINANYVRRTVDDLISIESDETYLYLLLKKKDNNQKAKLHGYYIKKIKLKDFSTTNTTSLKIENKDKWYFRHETSYMTKKYIVIRTNSALLIYNKNMLKWKTIDISKSNKFSPFAVKGEIIYLPYQNTNGSGISKININTNSIDNFISSRKKTDFELENGFQYKIGKIYVLEDFLIILVDDKGFFLYNLNSKKWTEITRKNIDIDFIKNYIKTLINLRTYGNKKFNLDGFVLNSDKKYIYIKRCFGNETNQKILKIQDFQNIQSNPPSNNSPKNMLTNDGNIFYEVNVSCIKIFTKKLALQKILLNPNVKVIYNNAISDEKLNISVSDKIYLTSKYFIVKKLLRNTFLIFSLDEINEHINNLKE